MKNLLAIITCLYLGGCDSGQTVSWYKAHDAERVQRAKECRDDAKAMVTVDCQNATAAQSEVTAFGK